MFYTLGLVLIAAEQANSNSPVSLIGQSGSTEIFRKKLIEF